jgi:chromosome segregation protein
MTPHGTGDEATMYLKRLEMHGFKSFASRTEIEFLPGVNAIVGPNGSGKSNIAEAIQWVLGERSYKAIRGTRSTDVIFAGSQKLNPMNIAEVTVVFDNSDYGTPIGFSEVAITRRIYRSGECDYFINKTPCRLRDIQKLLLDLGLSADSFAIISQNDVEAILMARPDEMRAIFEQVAGVERYQINRSEALRKLEKTEMNIVRLKDLRRELEMQLEPIAKQAELARQYNELMQRYVSLQVSLIGWEWGVRQKRLQKLCEEKTAWQQKLRQIEEDIEAIETERKGIEKELKELEEQLAQLRERSVKTVEMAKSVESEIELVKQSQSHLRERIEAEENELRRRLEKQQALQNRLESVRSRMQELEKLIEEHKREHEGLERALSNYNAQVEDKENEIELLRSQHVEAMRVIMNLRNKLIDCERSERTLRHRLMELEKERSEVEGQIESLSSTTDQLEAEMSEIAHSKDELQKRLRVERQTLATLEREIDELRHRAGALRELLSGLKARLSTLEESEAALEGVREGPKSVLMASRAGKLPSAYTLVAHLLNVPREIELAIAAALGSSLEYIVTETTREVEVAIEYLKRNKLGRATFLTLDFIRPRPRRREVEELLKVVGDDSVIGWACELVDAEEKYKVVVEYLLGNVLVVKDMGTAKEIGKRAKDGIRIVTLDGELVIPGGPISGGYEMHSLHILLARRREIEELRQRIHEFETKLRSCEQGLRERLKEAEHCQNKIEAISGELSALVEREAKASAEMEASTQRLAQLKTHLELIESERSQIEDELTNITSEREAITLELQSVEAQANMLEESVAEAISSLNELRTRRDELNSRLSEVHAKLAQLAEKFNATRSEESDIANQLEEEKQRARMCEEALQSYETQLQNLQRLLPELEEKRRLLLLSREETEREFEGWLERRRELLERLEMVDMQAKEKMQEKSSVEGELNKVEVRMAEVRSEGEELARRLVEEFGIQPLDALKRAEAVGQKQTITAELNELKMKIEQMGAVNVGAIEEYERLKARIDYLAKQQEDLETAREDLKSIIRQIDEEAMNQLIKTIADVESHFQMLFANVFGGGEAHIHLTGDDFTESGVEVKVRLPGKATQNLMSLSGGEKAMTAICLLFAMLSVRPVPFCILDEVDAALDDVNISKFADMLRQFSKGSQFIVITHNYGTLEAVDHIYGVTMGDDGVSRVFSLSLEEAVTRLSG